MPETAILTNTRYTKLLKDLKALIQSGKKRAEAAAAQELIQTYWEVGKRISEEKLTENANYGDSILVDLAEDLDIDVATLRRSIDCYKTYKIHAPRSMNLTWSHYKALLGITSGEEREFYEKKADEGAWTKEELTSAIRRDLFNEGKPTKGKPRKTKLTRPTEATYVYKALVERVIDGDTQILRIDLGFTVWKEQRIRLAGIDCPPIDEPKGYEAFEFVRDELARVPFVMVKTHQIDIHGRYVAHVFYSFTEKNKDKVFSEGKYLNQELLDRGLARLA